jgi:phospholipid transport system substrate-binding protein
LAATTGTFAAHDHAGRGARPGPRPASQLYRLKLSTTRFASQILAGFARAVVAADLAPGLLVKACVGEVVSMMRRNVSQHALRRFAEKKLWPRFDFKQMTRQAMGDVWHNASRQQQRSLEDGFRDLLLERYAASLSAAANSRMQFEVKPVRHSSANDVTVKTLITRNARPAVAIDFRMENQRNGWKVYDVLVDGVSVQTTYLEIMLEDFSFSESDGPIEVPKATRRKPATRPDSQRGAFT